MADGVFEPLWKAEALRTLAGRNLWLGVASALTRSNETGEIVRLDEETDRAYMRQRLHLSDPVPVGAGGREAVNVETIRFPAYALDAAKPLAWWFVVTEPIGGDVLVSAPLEARSGRLPQLEEGDELVFRQGDLRIAYP